MRNRKTVIEVLRKSWLLCLAVILLIVAVACSLWVNFGMRMPVELKDRTVGLLIDYDELKRIADGSMDTDSGLDIEFSDMLRKASLAGATGIVVRERILADWEASGDIIVFSGGQLSFQLETSLSGFAPQADNYIQTSGMLESIAPEKTYILTKDQLVHEQIFSLLETKRRYPESFEFSGYMGIVSNLHSSERATLGMGFPLKQLEEAAEAGFQIIPRLRNWEPVRRENLIEVFSWVARIPNLAAVGFNEQSIPGDATNPVLLDHYEAAMRPLNVPLVSFEFYDQIGLPALAARFDDNLLRAHAIAENELQNYTDFDKAMDRYALAAAERNIRYIYLRFQDLINPAASMEGNMELIADVRSGLIEKGLQVGKPEPIQASFIPMPVMFLLGAGVITAAGWLAAMAAEQFAKKKWRLIFMLMIILGFVGWAGALVVSPMLGRKLMALAAAVVFPGLAVVLVIKHNQKNERLRNVHGLLRSVLQLVIMSALAFMGAMVMTAILSEQRFMLKLDQFFGVTPAYVLPLAIIPLVLWLREKDWFALLSGAVRNSVRLWQLGVCFVLLAALTLYVLRSGNDAQDTVTDLELSFRQLLTNAFGVRPRTTEFLIGHPMMLMLLFYGYRFSMYPVLMVGIMGQISLINTYAHIHTPLLISMQRTFHGGWVGALIGVVCIGFLELLFRRTRSLTESNQCSVGSGQEAG